jgi:group I intron endonuclease
MYGIIYKITNRVNGKIYIGQTTSTLVKRWQKHQYKSHCTLLSRAIRKYGKDNFDVCTISRCSSLKEMNHRESYYIKLFKALSPYGYNLDSGGKNKKMSPESRLKISMSQKGKKKKPHTQEARNKMSASHFGKKASPETRLKLSNLRRGRKMSQESINKTRMAVLGKSKSEIHKQKLALAHTGKTLSEEHRLAISNGLKKKIICNETKKIYASTKDAALELGVKPCSIWLVLVGRGKTCKGYTFSYV